jgi:hypothetical protein
MLLDANLLVSGILAGTALAPVVTGQVVTGAVPVLSTNAIDLVNIRDIGEGNDLVKCRVEIVTTFTGLTFLQTDVIQADDAALSVNVTVIGSSGPIAVAALTTAQRYEIELNARIGSKGQRYLGVRYTPTGTGTAGAVVTDFGLAYTDGQKFYTSGYLVS